MTKRKTQLGLFDAQSDAPIVQVKVSVPAARAALSAFTQNRLKAFESFSNDLRESVSLAINDLLELEMSVFLGKSDQGCNKRNGYRTRDYYLKGVGCLRLEFPRDRNGEFESVIVPSHERIDPRTRQDLSMLYLAGLSNRTLSMISRRLLGIEVSKTTVSNSLSELKVEAEKWLTREITERYWALYIDGTNFKVQRRGSTEREPSLVVLGVNDTNHRSVIAVEPGTRDNVESWRSVFRSLKQRGFEANAVRIGIMDGLPGLERLFNEEFPNAVTARCWVHAKKNALAKSPARFRDGFEMMITKVMYASSEDDARKAFARLKDTMGNDATRAVNCIAKDLDSLLVHYRFEDRFWKALKTTNAIERLNKEFKRRTKIMETIGEGTLMAVIAFTALKLEMGWQIHPIDSKALRNLPAEKTDGLMKINKVEHAIEKLEQPIQ